MNLHIISTCWLFVRLSVDDNDHIYDDDYEDVDADTDDNALCSIPKRSND